MVQSGVLLSVCDNHQRFHTGFFVGGTIDHQQYTVPRGGMLPQNIVKI